MQIKKRERLQKKKHMRRKKDDLKKEINTNHDLINERKERIAQNTLANDDLKKNLVLLKKNLETSRTKLKETNDAYAKEENDNKSKLEDTVQQLNKLEAEIKEIETNSERTDEQKEADREFQKGLNEAEDQFGELVDSFEQEYNSKIINGFLNTLTEQFIAKFKDRDISLWSSFIENLKKLLDILNNCQNLSGENFEEIIKKAEECVVLLPGIVDYQESDLLIHLINNESGEFKFDIFDEGNDDAKIVKKILSNIEKLFTSLSTNLTIDDANALSTSFTIFRNNYDIHTEIYDIVDSIGANTAKLNTSDITKSDWDNENFAQLFDSTPTYEMGVRSRNGDLTSYNEKYKNPDFFNHIKIC